METDVQARLMDMYAMLSRIDERTASIVHRITQHDRDLDSLKKRHWMISGVVALVVWLATWWKVN